VVTVMSIVPAACEGEVMVQLVAVQATLVAELGPKLAVVEPVTKPVPVTVTTVPPTSGPALELTAVIAGVVS